MGTVLISKESWEGCPNIWPSETILQGTWKLLSGQEFFATDFLAVKKFFIFFAELQGSLFFYKKMRQMSTF